MAKDAERLVKAVPWGRTFAEYRAMFDLEGRPFRRAGDAPRVLDLGGGPASFTAEAHAKGWRAVACDPIYALDGEEIAVRVEAAKADVMALVRAQRDRFVWDRIDSPETLERMRLAALADFLSDYDGGRAEGRYRAEALPALDLPDGVSDLALCSHLLFLYAETLDADFHVAAIHEMLRVAREARIFPLLDMTGAPSSRLDPVMARLGEAGLRCEVLPVPYEFQESGNEMLLVTAPA